MAFAIRAAYLWQKGEYYSYDPLLPPPLCWIPATPDEGEGEGEPTGGKLSLSRYYVPFENTIVPNSPTYTLPVDVDAISNYDQINTLFSIDSADTLLSTNGFAVLEHDWSQHFYDVEENDDIISPYRFLYESGIPMFITADTLLHLYHVQFDETLKEVEETEFYEDITGLTDALSVQAQAAYETLDGSEEAANAATFSICCGVFLTHRKKRPIVFGDGGAGTAHIKHRLCRQSPVCLQRGLLAIRSRGHYTRSENRAVFQGTMWCGACRFYSRATKTGGRQRRYQPL